MLRQFPVFRIAYRQWPSFVWQQDLDAPGGADKLINELNRRYLLASDVPNQLAGWVPALPHNPEPAPNAPLGISNPLWGGGQGRVSWQQDVGDGNFTLAHEIGHNLGLRHVNTADGCGAIDPHTDWPYGAATIPEEGFDPITMRVVSRSKKDVMTYCSPSPDDIWVSPHTYRKLFESGQQPRAGAVARDEPYLLVSGTFYRDGLAVLEPAYQFTSSRIYDQPPVGDDFCLVLQSEAGVDLDSRCVDVDFVDHVTRETVDQIGFPFALPNPENATRVVVRQDRQERAVIQASANAPTATILSPTGADLWDAEQTITWEADDADGDALTYAVAFSRDDGASWITLVTNLTEPNYAVNAAELAGGEAARIRVSVSDGMNTTHVESEPFQVADKGPTVVLLTPDGAQRFGADKAIVFTGDGYDPEDGLLPDDALVWRSDLDGELGRGTTVTSGLSNGEHLVTVSAEDSDGNRAATSITITVTEFAFRVHLPSIMR